MLKHVCTSVWLNQHASINTMNNTRENVWLSPKKCLKHLIQTISLSYRPFSAFLYLRVEIPKPSYPKRRGLELCITTGLPLSAKSRSTKRTDSQSPTCVRIHPWGCRATTVQATWERTKA